MNYNTLTKEQFREIRKAMGMSQAEFGNVLGIGKDAVFAKEKGIRAITDRDKNMLRLLSK